VRVSERTRRCLERSTTVLSTRYGQIRVKVARRGEAILHVAPEYEDCKRAARQHGVTLSAVYQEAVKQAIEDSGLRDRADHVS
jgi:uncharacterized protein (DUF111 family)